MCKKHPITPRGLNKINRFFFQLEGENDGNIFAGLSYAHFAEDVCAEGEKNEQYARLLGRIGREKAKRWQPNEDYQLLLTAYQMCKETLGERHPDTIQVQMDLADLSSYPLQKFRFALELCEDLLPIYGEERPAIEQAITGLFETAIEAGSAPTTTQTVGKVADLLEKMARDCHELEWYEKELFYRGKLVSLMVKSHGRDAVKTIRAKVETKKALRCLGREEEALVMEWEILSLAEESIKELAVLDWKEPDEEGDGEDDEDDEVREKVESLIGAAEEGIKQAKGSYRKEAERLEDELLGLLRKIYGAEDNWHTLQKMEDMAKERRGEEAVVLWKDLFETRWKDRDELHPGRVAEMEIMAHFLEKSGATEKASQLREKLRRIRWEIIEKLRTSGVEDVEEHLDSLHEECDQLHWLGELEEATQCRKRIVEILQKECGEEDERTLRAWDDLAEAYSDQKKDDEALAIWKNIVAIHRRRLEAARRGDGSDVCIGNELYEIHEFRDIIADFLNDRNRKEEELEVRKEILADTEAYDSDLMDYTQARTIAVLGVARVLRDLGRYREAAEMQKTAIAMRNLQFGQESEPVLSDMRELALDLENMGNFGEAARAWAWIADVSEKNLGSCHSNTVMARHNVVHAMARNGNPEKALALQEKVEDECRRSDKFSGNKLLKSAECVLDICKILVSLGKGSNDREREIREKAMELFDDMAKGSADGKVDFCRPEEVEKLLQEISPTA